MASWSDKFIVFVVGPISTVNIRIATAMSSWLGCPRLLIKDILRGLRTPLVVTEGSSSSSAAAAQVVDDVVANKDQLACMALRILFSQAETILKKYWIPDDDGLVLEFTAGPEELPTVYTLFEVMKEKNSSVNRGLIIHYSTIPSDHTFIGGSDYHSYADVREAIHQQLTCSLSSSSPPCVSKLEIEVDYDWASFIAGSSGEPPSPSNSFYQAIEYMLFNHNLQIGEVPLSITMRQWPKFRLDLHRSRYGHRLPTDLTRTSLCFKGSDYHYIILITSDDKDKCNNNNNAAAPRMCRQCDKPVLLAADDTTAAASTDSSTSHDVDVYYYSCAFCPLYLHKDCAEMKGYEKLSEFVLHRCRNCQEGGGKEQFSNCKACLFDSVLKSRLWPTIISHPFFHQVDHDYSFLQIQVSTTINGEFCAACGYQIRSYPYISLSNNLLYGFSCLTQLPVEEIEQTHFRHRHPLKLMSKPHQKLDYYLCHVCCNEREENRWYYFCEECEYTAHLDCIHPQLYNFEHIDYYH